MKAYNHFTDKHGNEYKFTNYMEFAKFWFNLSRKYAAANSKEARTKV